MDNETIAMALRMIGKNIMLIADAIYKEPEPVEVDEKPKKKARKTSKASKYSFRCCCRYGKNVSCS
ncbi:MAG: hypothetical protein IIY78_05015 [Clostridia bacterium]|nr:hypothetical protein [Clostridia bacterium]